MHIAFSVYIIFEYVLVEKDDDIYASFGFFFLSKLSVNVGFGYP
jgi:hypothetical protein